MRTQLDVHHLVREAVANAARHGGAQQVQVALSGEQDHLRLDIADDGRGFAPAAGSDEIASPSSLSGRVKEAGGEMTVTSTPGNTVIVIRVPLEGRP